MFYIFIFYYQFIVLHLRLFTSTFIAYKSTLITSIYLCLLFLRLLSYYLIVLYHLIDLIDAHRCTNSRNSNFLILYISTSFRVLLSSVSYCFIIVRNNTYTIKKPDRYIVGLLHYLFSDSSQTLLFVAIFGLILLYNFLLNVRRNDVIM